MRRLWGEIDLHVVAMLLILAPVAFLGWWGLAILFLVPQGRIGTRAVVDVPAFGRRPWVYLFVNELLVIAVVGLLAVGRLAITAVV